MGSLLAWACAHPVVRERCATYEPCVSWGEMTMGRVPQGSLVNGALLLTPKRVSQPMLQERCAACEPGASWHEMTMGGVPQGTLVNGVPPLTALAHQTTCL
ncbi:hypothetical protein NDU88_004441 [Pleurodeles waltl]|uniref:Uncharacterized protein n=1 Tax=Pleurodeles waltl TaxID=8319 RepID=A0AAV7PJT8_PLEWA|nr:hypothetical protein NDU88_004441 [Pleurodeles waltl]